MAKNELLARTSDVELEEAFEEAFDDLASNHDVTSYDFSVERGVGDDAMVSVVVHVTAMDTCPTPDEFRSNEELQTLTVEVKGQDVEFTVTEVLVINNLDYDVSYGA